MQLFNKFIDVK